MASTLSESSRIPTNPSRIVLITGVSKGLGRALALELANRGHTIIGCSRDQPKLDSLRQQLSSNNHLLFNANVRSNDSVEELARAVVQNKLVPDIIGVANRIGNAWEVEVEEFDNVIDTNVKGIANVLRHFIPLMIPNKHGIIINMSSIAGRTGIAHGQDVWDAMEHGDDVDERKDRMTLAAIYQVVLEDIFLMLAEKDSSKEAWETLQTMHVGVKRVKEAKVQTLKSEFEAICMKDGESADSFTMKFSTIVIHSLGDKVEEISIVKKFLEVILPRFMQIVSSIESLTTSRI
ncbi:levodione reductase-like isoform X2 [Cucurbita pepo subsp. pepo]|uniref:levodione reductase-like isoform X2 n=1 Tax=Cucurbita pepo subsp. pepo TaxID=3664 RepID=UPI000C9D4A8F|nr:levodione reductase-like isoform X2 [Cucurbita pepo subsp. pepo]